MELGPQSPPAQVSASGIQVQTAVLLPWGCHAGELQNRSLGGLATPMHWKHNF